MIKAKKKLLLKKKTLLPVFKLKGISTIPKLKSFYEPVHVIKYTHEIPLRPIVPNYNKYYTQKEVVLNTHHIVSLPPPPPPPEPIVEVEVDKFGGIYPGEVTEGIYPPPSPPDSVYGPPIETTTIPPPPTTPSEIYGPPSEEYGPPPQEPPVETYGPPQDTYEIPAEQSFNTEVDVEIENDYIQPEITENQSFDIDERIAPPSATYGVPNESSSSSFNTVRTSEIEEAAPVLHDVYGLPIEDSSQFFQNTYEVLPHF